MEGENKRENMLQKITGQITPLDKEAMEKARLRVDDLTKPPGSLGRLEDLSIQLAGIKGDFFPTGSRKRVVIMAADHGVTEEGISAFPSEVTGQMLSNFAAGGAGINVLSNLGDVEIKVVDVGVATEYEESTVKQAKIRPGTANFCEEPAMSREEAVDAVMTGVEIARESAQDGVQVLATGEMGIGNTTASSAVMAAFTGYEASLVVGRGSGLDDEKLLHKQSIVEKALKLHKPNADDPVEVVSKVGGLEIAGLAGLIIGAAYNRIPVVIDGFISTAAALLAVNMASGVKDYLIPSHQSMESGHALLLDYLNLQPYLNMNMRLGEGTGAVLAMQLVEAAARITLEMATFSDAGISKEADINEPQN